MSNNSYPWGEHVKHSNTVPSFFISQVSAHPASPNYSNCQGDVSIGKFLKKCIPSPPSEAFAELLGITPIMVDDGFNKKTHPNLKNLNLSSPPFLLFFNCFYHHLPKPFNYRKLQFSLWGLAV